MKEDVALPYYIGYRFPAEIISHAVWLYFRFALSYRDVEELLAERGVIVTDETVRQWCQKFGQPDANALRQRRPRPGDKWHLDEVFVSINGVQQYLWRAVDQDGNSLDILVQRRRATRAAVEFLRKLLKGLAPVPRVLITDTSASYGAAKREVLPSVEHRQHKRLNNRAESAHQPTRERERRMRRFKSAGHSQRFLAARAATASPPPSTAKSATSASPPGAPSSACPPPPERRPRLGPTRPYASRDPGASLKLTTPATSTFTVKLAAGATFSLPTPLYKGVISGIWDTVNGTAQVTEY